MAILDPLLRKKPRPKDTLVEPLSEEALRRQQRLARRDQQLLDSGPVNLDPAGVGVDLKPLEMPTMDSAALEEYRRRMLLLQQSTGGRRSTILTDYQY